MGLSSLAVFSITAGTHWPEPPGSPAYGRVSDRHTGEAGKLRRGI